MKDEIALKAAGSRDAGAACPRDGQSAGNTLITVVSQLERGASYVANLTGMRRALLAAVLGGACGLAFAPIDAWPVMFVSFGLLVWLLDGCYLHHASLRPRLKLAALVGLCFGFGYFLASLHWVAEAFLVDPERDAWLLPFVMIGMPTGVGLYFAAAAALAMLLWGPGAIRAFALAIAFGLAEFARGHLLTGLPWNLIGYSLLGNQALMQLASLFGGYAMSLLAVLLFASPASMVAPRGSMLARGKGAAVLTCLALLLLSMGFVWGEHRLAVTTRAPSNFEIRIVQADIDQANKWRPENATEIFDEYLDLTKSSAHGTGLEGISLVVWPETAVPFLLGNSPEALRAIGEILPNGTSLAAGSARLVEQADPDEGSQHTRIYNSLLSIDDKGEVLDSYDKMHLVPFGEYLPFQDFMESMGIFQLTGIRGGFSSGAGPRLLSIPGAPAAAPLICYEIIFPDQIIASPERPGFLLNVTNDAWFGSSAGPYQHFQQARFRAVEQGLPVVRAANTGISGVIDAYGRVVAELGLGKRGVIDAFLPQELPPTVFARFERWIELAVLCCAIFGWLACRVHALKATRRRP